MREPRTRPSAADVAAFLAESPRLLVPCPDMPPVTLALDVEVALGEVSTAGGGATLATRDTLPTQ